MKIVMNIALLLAAGKSKRFGGNKLFAVLDSKPVIFHSLKLLENSSDVDRIFIAANPQNRLAVMKLVRREKFKKVKKIFLGGCTRYESVTKIIPKIFSKNFLRGKFPQNIIIHNAANPLATQKEIVRCLSVLKPGISGAAAGCKIHSTIKQAATNGWDAPISVEQTIPRQNLWCVETPQVVRTKDFLKACKNLPRQEFDYTDDLSVLEAAGMNTVIVEASPQNKKITSREDLEMLKMFMRKPQPEFAIGIGEDSHKFKVKSQKSKVKSARRKSKNRKLQRALMHKTEFLVLGGVKIKNLPALEAESDGDVIIHALCNAIASALSKGSLGTYATKMRKRGIRDSKKYLQKITAQMKRERCGIKNCSFSIEAAYPQIDPLVPAIKKSLSKLLEIPRQKIGITATSGESLTPFGRGEAIRCQAVVLLQK